MSYLIKAKTAFRTTRKVNGVTITESQTASASTSLAKVVATLNNVNKSILKFY